MTTREIKKQELTNTLRDNEKACVILQLPDHIILEIFSKIPINTLIQCKYVCRSWRRSLSDPEFTKSLFARTPAYLFLQDHSTGTPSGRSRNTRRRRLGLPPNKHLLANLENLSSPNNMVLKLSDPNALYNRLHSTTLMCSCNGFLCLCRFNAKIGASIFNISNPITRECMPLPVNEETCYAQHFGFGFSPISDVYKVVVFAAKPNNKRKRCRDLDVMVLTVGSGIWRRIGKVRDTLSTQVGIFREGRLHWVSRSKTHGSYFIRAFDVETERFKDLPMPPHRFGSSFILQMGVIGDLLSVNDGWTFWVMKEYGKASWIKVLEIERKTVRYTIRDYTNRVEVLKFMEGEVLLLIGYIMWLYTPETKTLVRVEFDEMPSEDLSFVVDHIPSFVSPKDIINDYNSKVCS